MRLSAKTIRCVVILMAVLLISSRVPAREQPHGSQTSGAESKAPSPAPDLADVIPSAATLTGHLTALENKIKGGLDISAFEKKYDGIEVNLKGPEDQLQRLKDSKEYKYNKLLELGQTIKEENESFEKISKPLTDAIRRLETWRKEWLTEKKRWNEWQSSLLEEGAIDQLKSTFEKANDTIDVALNLILPQLEAILTVQEKAGHIQTKIIALSAELDGLILDERLSVRLDKSPPMFSPRYFSQFSSELWYAAQNSLNTISWPGRRFFVRQGWVVFLQGFISLFVIIAVYRKREVLNESKRWRFLAARPISAGLFLGCMTTLLIYEYQGAPAIWKMAHLGVTGISFARVTGGLIEALWKRQFVYGLMIVLIVTGLMDALNLPLPLFRLYTILTALVGLVFCLRWAGKSDNHKDSGLYAWALRLGSLFFGAVMIAELWGKKDWPYIYSYL